MKIQFEEYIKSARKTFDSSYHKNSKKWADEEILADLINTNLKICRETIRHAEKMNWGRHSHTGNSTLHKIRYVYDKVSKSKTLDVDENDFYKMCKLKQTLGDTMWMAEHGV